MKSLSLPLAAAALSLTLAACGEDSGASGKTLRFTAIPDANKTELEEKFGPVAAYLSEQLGVPVEYVPVSTYDASVEAFKNGEVHLAWFGGVSGAQAREAVPGSLAIAQGKVDPEYKSYFIANASTGIEPSDEFPMDLAGTKFTFGARSSTSGRVMPQYFIEEITGKSPEDLFGSIDFSGSHDKTALDVAEGAFEAGVLSYKKYDSMVANNQIDPEVCRIVWTTPTYPDYNWTAHPSIDLMFSAGTIERVQKALVEMKDPALLEACLRDEGMIEASNEDFQPIVDVSRKLGFLR